MTENESEKYSAREATEADLPAIADFFTSHDYGPKELEWLRWKLLDNPDGPAFMYVVEEVDGGIVGFQARLPRRFEGRLAGTFSARQEVDMFIAPQARKKGLRRKISEVGDLKRDYLVMGFPNRMYQSMMTLDDMETVIPMEKWAYPLNIGVLFANKPYGFVAPLANLVSRLYSSICLGSPASDIEMKPVERFERGYTIDMEFIHGVRSVEYLNWRFIDNPIRRYSAFEFYEGGESIGYCAYTEVNKAVELFDFVVDQHPKKCLRLLVDHCRAEGLSHISFKCAGFQLGGWGFVNRGATSDFIMGDNRNGPYRPHGSWMITLADSDYE